MDDHYFTSSKDKFCHKYHVTESMGEHTYNDLEMSFFLCI